MPRGEREAIPENHESSHGSSHGSAAEIAAPEIAAARPDPPPRRVGEDRFPARAALVILWLLLALVVVVRRSERAEEVRLPDRALPPVMIDLNRDPWPRLLLIEGIGEALARRIVAAREECGGFREIAEVQALPGVPDEAIERARPWLKLGPRRDAETVLPAEGGAPPAGESRAGP